MEGVMRSIMRNLAALLLVSGLVACGGGGGADATTSGAPTISGLAAVGAALPGAAVTARCAAGPDIAGITDTNGRFTLTLNASNEAPCMLKVVSTAPAVTLYSFAADAGTVNVSPLTDWVVSKALGSDPALAFDGFDRTKGSAINAGLAAAKTYARQQADAISGTPRTTDPLVGAFVVGDADDQVLDKLAAAMTAAGKTLGDVRTAAASGSDLSILVPPYVAPGTSSGGDAGSGVGGTTTGVFVDRTRPTGGDRLPGKLVWTGTQFVGLEQSTDFHNASATFSVWKSADGISWTRSSTNLPSHFVGLSSANGKAFYIKADYASSPFNVYSSDDALSWSASSATYTGFAVPTGVKYLNGRYFVNLDVDTCAVVTSTDASTWTTTQLSGLALPNNYFKDANSKYCSAPFYVNGKYVVYGGTIEFFDISTSTPPVKGLVYSSTDGVNWTVNTFDLPAGARKLTQGGRENTTVMVGDTVVLATDNGKIGTSSDGLTFTFASPTGLAGTSGSVNAYFPSVVVNGAVLAATRTFTSGVVLPDIQYFWTSNGVDYTSAPNLGLLNARGNDPLQAYSPTLKRLVRMQAGTNGVPTVQTYDFP